MAEANVATVARTSMSGVSRFRMAVLVMALGMANISVA